MPFGSAVQWRKSRLGLAVLSCRRRARLTGDSLRRLWRRMQCATPSSGGGPSRKDATMLLVVRRTDRVEFAYHRGCTLSVSRSVALLSILGNVCYPILRPVAAAVQTRGGRFCVVGSAEAFSDDWLCKECNAAIDDTTFRWLSRPDAAGSTPAGSAGGGSGAERDDDAEQDDDAEINVTIIAFLASPNGGAYGPCVGQAPLTPKNRGN